MEKKNTKFIFGTANDVMFNSYSTYENSFCKQMKAVVFKINLLFLNPQQSLQQFFFSSSERFTYQTFVTEKHEKQT